MASASDSQQTYRSSGKDRVAIGFCLVFPTLVTLAYFVWFADRADALKVAYGVGKVVQFGFPIAFAWLYLRDRIGWPQRDHRGIIFGFLFGAIIALLTLMIYAWVLKPFGALDAATGEIQAKVAGFGIASAAAYFGLATFYSLAHSGLEEYYWRWFVFGQLRQISSLAVAIAVSSIGFMAHHVVVLGVFFGWTSPLTYLLSAAIAIGGAVWAWLYNDSKSLLAPWISHALVDAGIFLVGYDLVRGNFA